MNVSLICVLNKCIFITLNVGLALKPCHTRTNYSQPYIHKLPAKLGFAWAAAT